VAYIVADANNLSIIADIVAILGPDGRGGTTDQELSGRDTRKNLRSPRPQVFTNTPLRPVRLPALFYASPQGAPTSAASPRRGDSVRGSPCGEPARLRFTSLRPPPAATPPDPPLACPSSRTLRGTPRSAFHTGAGCAFRAVFPIRYRTKEMVYYGRAPPTTMRIAWLP
jgi:hypothetical protein